MEWPKLKNIILVILVMTNLCLFFFVIFRVKDVQLFVICGKFRVHHFQLKF